MSQETFSSEDALKQYEEITETMSKSFPEDDLKTYSRQSYSQQELETYLSQHLQRMDLLRFIKGHHTLKLYAYLHSGNWFKIIGFPKESIKSYESFFDYYEKYQKELTATERKNFLVMRFFAHSVLAENYADVGKSELASKQHLANMAFTKDLNDIYYPSAINNYGLFLFWHKKELDSALVYFQKAFDIIRAEFPNNVLTGSIRDNIADIYVEQKNYLKAQPLYAENFKFYNEVLGERSPTKDFPRLISAGSQLVETDVQLNRIEEAQIAFGELENIINTQRQIKPISPESHLEYLRAKEQLLHKQNNNDAAYTTAKHIERYSDSLHDLTSKTDRNWQSELNDITVDRIALNFKIDQLQKETKIKSQQLKLWITGLTSSVFIILLLFLFLSRHQHLINSKNKQLLAEQNLENSLLKVNQLNSEIKSKERDLSDFAINLIQNQEWATGLAGKMEVYKTSDQSNQKVILNDLEQVIKNKITFDKDTTLFFQRLDKLSDAFYSQLMTNYPNLSKNEIQLCSLIRLKMDSRSIATLQNITNASLNTSRYRLRKKLELSDDVNLDDFIQQL
ncbi:MAG: tetratricopeptide repeat protein [Aquaticitalea sp.]